MDHAQLKLGLLLTYPHAVYLSSKLYRIKQALKGPKLNLRINNQQVTPHLLALTSLSNYPWIIIPSASADASEDTSRTIYNVLNFSKLNVCLNTFLYMYKRDKVLSEGGSKECSEGYFKLGIINDN